MTFCESPLFQTIAPPKTPWTRWAASLGAHLAMFALIIAIPVGVNKTLQSRRTYLRVQLIAPRPAPPPPPVKPVYRRVPLSSELRNSQKKKFAAPVEIARVKRPVIAIARIESPVTEPAKVELPAIELPRVSAAPVIKPAVKTGIFAENQPAPAGRQTSHDIKTGGFGDPEGVRPSETSAGKGLVMARTGSFDLPSGAGRGSAGNTRAIASAGFGDGGSAGASHTGGGRGGQGDGQVRSGVFGDRQQSTPAPARAAIVSAPASSPVEIISKPKPVYTAEARERRVEGEVQLDVLFRASGQVQVLRVIRGLGLGLDGAATTAASQIRFRPGTRDGNPADMRGIVHIVFQLS
jgi:TonB family protein